MATSHLGLPRVQQQSRFELSFSCHGAFMRVCVRRRQIEITQKQQYNWFCFGSFCCGSNMLKDYLLSVIGTFLFCLDATSSHTEYNLGITAAVATTAHPPNTSFQFQKHPCRIQQSNSSRRNGTAAAAAAVKQQRTLHQAYIHQRNAVFCFPVFPLFTL